MSDDSKLHEAALQVLSDNIPMELKQRPQWVLWRLEQRVDDKPTKVPYRTPYKGKASRAAANKPTTWTTFLHVLTFYRRSGFSGIGFVFSADDPYCGIDLDHCRDGATGVIEPWAQAIIDRCGSYAEVSPSGTGVKIFCRGRLPGKGKRRSLDGDSGQAIEVYDQRHYFAVTGYVLPGLPAECQDCQQVIDELWQQYFAQEAKSQRKSSGTSAHRSNGHASNALDRCRKYVAKMPPAISGQGGHIATFSVACECFRFGLSDCDAASVLAEYNSRCQPPWNDKELQHKLSGAKERVTADGELGSRLHEVRAGNVHAAANSTPNGERQSAGPPTILRPDERTEAVAGRRFVAMHGNDVRYCAPWGKWLIWDGTRWRIDDICRIEALAKQTAEAIWSDIGDALRFADKDTLKALLSFGKNTASANGVAHMLTLARSESGVPILPAKLDSDPRALNVANGTINLRTGELREHRHEDYFTKLCPVTYDAGADCPLFYQSLHEWMAGDRELIGFLRRLAGYWLTGSVSDHVLPIFHGAGANGKSVYLSTMQALLGPDYAMSAPPDLLMVKRNEAHPTERADLFGRRLVCCIETESGRRLAESLVKSLTGADPIRARRMREDHWEFSPTHKLVIAANHRPIVRGTDHGIWRRLRLVPWSVTISQERQDKALPQRLLEELPGILNWALLGCAEWQQEGLGEPAAVMAATDEYRGESDTIAQYIAERCIVKPSASVPGGRLYENYENWCKSTGEHAESNTAFGRRLTAMGFLARSSRGGKVREGIGLLADNDAQQAV